MKIKKSALNPNLNENLATENITQRQTAQREQMIADAAYFRAERRGFHPMNDLADWFEAEAEIDRHLFSFSA
jgi:aspartate oxidase